MTMQDLITSNISEFAKSHNEVGFQERGKIMGHAKEEWLRQQAKGYGSPPEKAVCDECVADSALARVVQDSADSTKCDYCGKTKSRPFACPVEVVVSHIADCINER